MHGFSPLLYTELRDFPEEWNQEPWSHPSQISWINTLSSQLDIQHLSLAPARPPAEGLLPKLLGDTWPHHRHSANTRPCPYRVPSHPETLPVGLCPGWLGCDVRGSQEGSWIPVLAQDCGDAGPSVWLHCLNQSAMFDFTRAVKGPGYS